MNFNPNRTPSSLPSERYEFFGQREVVKKKEKDQESYKDKEKKW